MSGDARWHSARYHLERAIIQDTCGEYSIGRLHRRLAEQGLTTPTAQIQALRLSDIVQKQNHPRQNDEDDPETTESQNFWVIGWSKYNVVGALGLEPRTKGL